MRLIDADSLETHEIYEGEWVRVVYADDIDNAPTIDADPVRRGRWEVIYYDNIPKIAKCSECEEVLVFTKRDHLIRHMPNYCPNCGAKME